DLALGAGDRRVVDDGGLVGAAGLDVAVDRVVAGVADAARKPAAIDAGARIEDRLRRFDPVDLARSLAPETFGVLQRAAILLMIAAGARIHGAGPFGIRRLPDCAAV